MDEKIMAQRFDEAAASLGRIGTVLINLPLKIRAGAHEIRLRCGCPVAVSMAGETLFVTQAGTPACSPRPGLLTAFRGDMDEAFRLICESSVHAHQREIVNGFVTLSGGHRAGICGTAVLDGPNIANLRDISSVNLRIARQIRGAADAVAREILADGTISGCLIAGPPGCGKTTVLRDLARQLSDGTHGFLRVAVVDERGEIAAVHQGCAQNDLGPCCDVLDGYPKGEGILQAVRSLSPDVVICDELGGAQDARSVRLSLNAGSAVIASAHAGSIGDLMTRPHLAELLQCGAFRRVILLHGRQTPGKIEAVYKEGDLHAVQSGGADRRFYRLQRGGVSQIR